jgi:hypothetical protein
MTRQSEYEAAKLSYECVKRWNEGANSEAGKAVLDFAHREGIKNASCEPASDVAGPFTVFAVIAIAAGGLLMYGSKVSAEKTKAQPQPVEQVEKVSARSLGLQ